MFIFVLDCGLRHSFVETLVDEWYMRSNHARHNPICTSTKSTTNYLQKGTVWENGTNQSTRQKGIVYLGIYATSNVGRQDAETKRFPTYLSSVYSPHFLFIVVFLFFRPLSLVAGERKRNRLQLTLGSQGPV